MTKLSLSWNEIQEMARNIAHNSAVKIEATTRIEMNTSKSGKTAAQPTPSLDLDPSVHAPKQRIVTRKESGKL